MEWPVQRHVQNNSGYIYESASLLGIGEGCFLVFVFFLHFFCNFGLHFFLYGRFILHFEFAFFLHVFSSVDLILLCFCVLVYIYYLWSLVCCKSCEALASVASPFSLAGHNCWFHFCLTMMKTDSNCLRRQASLLGDELPPELV